MDATTRRRRVDAGGFDFGRVAACVLLFVLSVLGAAAVLVPFLFRFAGIRARVEGAAVAAVKDETGLDVRLSLDRALWPPGILVHDVGVASTDPQRPFATVREARVTLKPFSLLSGNVVIDSIELDGLEVDATFEEGKPIPTNLPLKLKEHPKTPGAPATDLPFRVVSLTNANIRAVYLPAAKPGEPPPTPIAGSIAGMDLDVDVVGDVTTPVFDVRLHKAQGAIQTPRLRLAPPPLDRFLHVKQPDFEPYKVVDEDVICAIAVDVQVTHGANDDAIELRNFELDARLDGDEALGSAPSCDDKDVADEQVAHVRLSRVNVDLPAKGEPKVSLGTKNGPPGKVAVRAPALLAARYVALPAVGGWASIDLDVAADVDLHDPLLGIGKMSASGDLKAHQIRLGYYRFGESIAGRINLDPPLVVSSKELDAKYADGDVKLTDARVELAPKPFDKKHFPVTVGVALKGVTFPGLMRELGVTKASHIRWDLDDGHVKALKGFLDPLELDGDLALKSSDFEVDQHESEGAFPARVVGIHDGIDLGAHMAIRADHISWDNATVRFGASTLAARVRLGFDEQLEVDATSDHLDLSEISPISTLTMKGVASLDVEVRGPFADVHGETKKLSITDFDFDHFALGDISTGHAKWRGDTIDIDALEGMTPSHESAYAVPSMRVDLGEEPGAPIVVDAMVHTGDFMLDDAYKLFHLEDDPRWKNISGRIGADARAHFALGGREDPCGTGHLHVDLDGRLLSADIYEERYVGGAANLSFDWWDFNAGALGMDLDLRAVTLPRKYGGTIVASGKILRGGRLAIHATGGAFDFDHFASMPQTTIPIEGSMDFSADVTGTFDDMNVDADVAISPIRIADETLERSHLHVARRPLPTIAPSLQPDARGCYTNIWQRIPKFDPTRLAGDPVDGEYLISGDLFGNAVHLEDFRVTDQTHKVARGTIAIRNLPLAPLAMLRMMTPDQALDGGFESPAPTKVDGALSADVALDTYPIDAWWDSSGTISGLSFVASSGSMGVTTEGTVPPIVFGKIPDPARGNGVVDRVKMGKTTIDLVVGDAKTQLVVDGTVFQESAATDPKIAASIELPSLPLQALAAYVPRIERLDGQGSAKLDVGGTVSAPTWSGSLSVTNVTASIKGLTMPIANVNGTVLVDPAFGVKIKEDAQGNGLKGEVGGGTINLRGGAALKGFDIGDVDLKMIASDVHFKYGDTASTTFGGTLHVTWSPPSVPGAPAELAHIAGVLDIDSFLYEKPVKVFDVNAIQAAQRTEVDAYDPTRDLMNFDVEIRAKHGFHVRNNLVDATVAIGDGGLHVVGTNQRFGVRGSLYVVQGGNFKFQNHDFEIREGTLLFRDETKIEPYIDVVAITDLRRAGGTGSTAEWRIRLHAYGESTDLKVELTSDPALSQEDIIFLLELGITRAEAASLGGTGVAGGIGFNFLTSFTGVDQTVKQAIPVIDDFSFGTAYSVKTGRTEPQITLGKRLANTLHASITSGFGENRSVLSNIEWQLSRRISIQLNYDNVNDVSSAAIGNVGADLRYRLDFE